MSTSSLHRIAAAAGLAGLALAAAVAPPSGKPADPPRRSEAAIRELDIEFYRKRVARDSYGATDRARLAQLYLERAREEGDYADLARAEELSRRSLALRRDRNQVGYAILASTLTAQHRFAEALGAAESLVSLDPGSASWRAQLGEIQLELGRYEEARRTFGMLLTRRRDPAVAPRLARWEELRGRPEAARRLLREARDRARHTHGVSAAQLAWYQFRLGDLALDQGRLNEARAELEAGLAIAPDDHRLLAALARLALVSGDPPTAIALGRRVIARVPDPGTFVVLYDASLALDDSAGARRYRRALATAVLAQPGPPDREWSEFLLGRNRDIPAVLARARAELETRKDVYGWDLYAWALHRSGRHAEAAEAMARALWLGTRDATLRYHAGMIARAVGDTAAARRHLEAALAINPHWHHAEPAAVRALLEALSRR